MKPNHSDSKPLNSVSVQKCQERNISEILRTKVFRKSDALRSGSKDRCHNHNASKPLNYRKTTPPKSSETSNFQNSKKRSWIQFPMGKEQEVQNATDEAGKEQICEK